MRMKNTWILLAAMLLSGCSSGKSWLTEVPVVELNAVRNMEAVPMPGDSISQPEIIASFGDYIVWSERKGNDLLKICRIDGIMLDSGIRKGRAADEILNVNQIMSQNGGFAICDIFKKKAFCYQIDGDQCRPHETFPIEGYNTIVVSGDTLIGTLKSGEHRYGLALKDGTPVFQYGDYSKYGLNTEIGCGLLQGHVAVNVEKGRLACFSYYADTYEISDYRHGEVLRSEQHEEFKFSGKDGGQVLMSPDSRLAFISVTSSSGHVFALYDGKDLKHYMANSGSAPCGNSICVFDWDGNYEKCLHLDRQATSIAWNPDFRKLYVSILMEDGEYSIRVVNDAFLKNEYR